ncbi:hypothetical protein [Faecalispora anaeroviscerum]|uniref:hypothetical protein n=1 Tax=Faecalispora anaeroviscerum TaxID=2991836 RepID=UPI0024B9C6FC|nr:hypothetical protein [Faecalispora anaeroviscerum]
MSFIKVPNILFDYYEVECENTPKLKKANQKIKYFSLEPVDICVFTYFLSCGGFINQKRIVRKCKTIAAHCGIKDPKTIRASVERLAMIGLITKCHRFNQWGHFAANGYQTAQLTDGGFFMFDTDYFRHELSVPEMCILLYLNRCRNSENSSLACPSISKMCFAINISKNTACKFIQQLVQKLFIKKEHYVSEQGDFGNNRYHLYSSHERNKLLRPFRRFKTKVSSMLKKFFHPLENITKIVRVIRFHIVGYTQHFSCPSFLSKRVGQKSPNTS